MDAREPHYGQHGFVEETAMTASGTVLRVRFDDFPSDLYGYDRQQLEHETVEDETIESSVTPSQVISHPLPSSSSSSAHPPVDSSAPAFEVIDIERAIKVLDAVDTLE